MKVKHIQFHAGNTAEILVVPPDASAEEISQVDGITLTLAEKIKEYL